MNLKRYSDIMGPAKNELQFKEALVPKIKLDDKSKSNIY